MKPLRDDYNYLCPLQRQEAVTTDADDPVTRWLVIRHCSAPLHLVVTETHDFESGVTPNGAITQGWEVVCEEGHRLMHSQGEEYAEPFELELALTVIYGEDAV